LFLLKASFFVRLVGRLVNSLLPSVRARIEDQSIYVGGKKKVQKVRYSGLRKSFANSGSATLA